MLKGRVAAITGPAKGMGGAVTRAFAEEGCRLALLARDTGAVEPLAAELRGQGRECLILPVDLTRPEECERAAARMIDAFGQIDVLVNVAGGSGPVGKSGVETDPA